MPQIIETEEKTRVGTIHTDMTGRRDRTEKLTALLPEIATDVTNAMAAIGLRIPIYFTMPSSGETIVNFITPSDDTTDADWTTACSIVCRILEDKIGFTKLIAREVACIGGGAQSNTNDSTVNPLQGV